MSNYFVEGTIEIKIDMDVEANSLEEAEELAFKQIKSELPMYHFMVEISKDHDLMAGQYDGEDYDEH